MQLSYCGQGGLQQGALSFQEVESIDNSIATGYNNISQTGDELNTLVDGLRMYSTSYVRDSVFFRNMDSAIDILDSVGIDLQNNLMLESMDRSLLTVSGRSRLNIIDGNLGIGSSKFYKSSFDLVIPSTFQIWTSAVESAINYVINNIASGADRVGFRIRGDDCFSEGSLIGIYKSLFIV